MNHELKIWPAFFAAVAEGTKTFEFRKDDRKFGVGDILILREWNPFAGGDPEARCKLRVWDNGGWDNGDQINCGNKMPCPTHLPTPECYGDQGWGSYTGRELRRKVTFILRGPAFGVPEDTVIMSIVPDE